MIRKFEDSLEEKLVKLIPIQFLVIISASVIAQKRYLFDNITSIIFIVAITLLLFIPSLLKVLYSVNKKSLVENLIKFEFIIATIYLAFVASTYYLQSETLEIITFFFMIIYIVFLALVPSRIRKSR